MNAATLKTLAMMILVGLLLSPAAAQVRLDRHSAQPSASEREELRQILGMKPGTVSVLVHLAPPSRNTASTLARQFASGVGGRLQHEYDLLPNVINLRDIPAQRLAELRALPGIVEVEEDRVYRASLNDSVGRIGARQSQITSAGYSADGAGVRICVVDTGVRPNHGMFSARLDSAASRNFAPDGSGNIDPAAFADDNGHGTHVAGIALARSGSWTTVDNVGVGGLQGVAPAATLVAAKVLRANATGSTSSILAGIDHCASATGGRADVINLSLGSIGFADPCDGSVVAMAANSAVDMGVVVVAASGNSASSIDTPACGSKVIAVGSTYDRNYPGGFEYCIIGNDLTGCEEYCFDQGDADEHVCTSNGGSSLDVTAPGCVITSGWHTGSNIVNDLCGTSMATPHVAGLAALLLSADPGLEPDDVRAAIQQGAVALGDPDSYGHGRISALGSLQLIDACDDGLFCNGVESFDATYGCVSTPPPCATPTACDEALDACAAENLLVNGDFQQGQSSWSLSCPQSSWSIVDGQAMITTSNAPGFCQLYQANLDLAPGTQYELRFDARHSTGAANIGSIKIKQHSSPFGTVAAIADNIDTTDQMQTYSYNFTTSSNPNLACDGISGLCRFRFELHQYDVAGTSYFFDNIRLCQGSCSNDPCLLDDDGDGTNNCEDLCPADPGKIDPGICGCGEADVDGDGDGAFACDDCDDDNVACTDDCSDSDGDGIAICAGDCDDFNPSCGFDCTDGDGDGFCPPVDCDDTDAAVNPAAIELCDDGVDGDCDGDDCTTGGGNLLLNGDFAQGTSDWSFSCPSSSWGVVNGELELTTSNAPGFCQLYQANLALTPGTLYELRFDARHSTGAANIGSIKIKQHSSPFGTVATIADNVDTTDQTQTFSYIFMASTNPDLACEGISGQCRFRFELHQYDVAGTSFFFDNVQLCEGSCASAAPDAQADLDAQLFLYKPGACSLPDYRMVVKNTSSDFDYRIRRSGAADVTCSQSQNPSQCVANNLGLPVPPGSTGTACLTTFPADLEELTAGGCLSNTVGGGPGASAGFPHIADVCDTANPADCGGEAWCATMNDARVEAVSWRLVGDSQWTEFAAPVVICEGQFIVDPADPPTAEELGNGCAARSECVENPVPLEPFEVCDEF